VSSAPESAPPSTYVLPDRRPWQMVVLGVVFLAALVVRVERTNRPPVISTPTRQYRSALIARAYYFRNLDSVPEWQKRVVASNRAKEGLLEAPIMEHLALLGYRITGGEHLWIPRSLSSLFWVIGGVFLYLTAKRVSSPDAALVATVFYLFVPYGVITSRTFQRDPMMIMFLLIGVFALVRYADHRSLRWLITAGVASALSIFVKPISFFPLFGAAVALTVTRKGFRRAVLDPHLLLFTVIALAPAAVYTLYGLFVGGFLTEQAGRSFFPETVLKPFFWHGWIVQIRKTVGHLALCLGLLGIFAFRQAFARALALGLWIGYVVFGLVFNYGIHTHAYYQLMLIPIIALSLAPLAELVLGWLHQQPRLRWVTRGVLVLGVGLVLEPVLWRRADPRLDRVVELREEIGDVVGHSTKTLILDRNNGSILKYHGMMCGDWWPTPAHFRLYAFQGLPEIDAATRLDAMIKELEPEYFIVADMGEYKKQSDLKDVLTTRYPVFRETDDYVIFDLKTRIDL